MNELVTYSTVKGASVLILQLSDPAISSWSNRAPDSKNEAQCIVLLFDRSLAPQLIDSTA